MIPCTLYDPVADSETTDQTALMCRFIWSFTVLKLLKANFPLTLLYHMFNEAIEHLP